MSSCTDTSSATLLSTPAELEAFLSSISTSSILYVDLEGRDLCRYGSLYLITILVYDDEWMVRLVDVFTLRTAAFTTTDRYGRTLKSIFEDPDIPKLFWDVRNDADALWAHYHVGLCGVIDLQLLENASRFGGKKFIRGLDKAIEFDLRPGTRELKRWMRLKKEIKVRFLSGVDFFALRPIDAKVMEYCASDVIHLPTLHEIYQSRIAPTWLSKVITESAQRVEESHSPDYQPTSCDKTLAPWGSNPAADPRTEDDVLDELDKLEMRRLRRRNPNKVNVNGNVNLNVKNGVV